MEKNLEEFFRPGTEEHALLAKLDPARFPRHIAVIMDGNGRLVSRERITEAPDAGRRLTACPGSRVTRPGPPRCMRSSRPRPAWGSTY